jgi:hypothetical protein
MKTLFRLLLVLWLLMLTVTQSRMIDATIYNTLTIRGLVMDVFSLQQKNLLQQEKRGLSPKEQ